MLVGRWSRFAETNHRLRRNRDAHSRRARSRLVACVTDGSAVPFQAALAALIKGQRSTASPDAPAQSASGRLMRSHVQLGVSPPPLPTPATYSRPRLLRGQLWQQRLRSGNDAAATTARANAASYESSPASSAAGRPLTTQCRLSPARSFRRRAGAQCRWHEVALVEHERCLGILSWPRAANFGSGDGLCPVLLESCITGVATETLRGRALRASRRRHSRSGVAGDACRRRPSAARPGRCPHESLAAHARGTGGSAAPKG
jgi:hypothetical protein